MSALRVVPAVYDEQRILRYDFHANWPDSGFQPFPDVFVSDDPSLIPKHFDHIQGNTGVLPLVFSCERDMKSLIAADIECLAEDVLRDEPYAVEVRLYQTGGYFSTPVFYYFFHGWRTSVDDGGPVFLDNSGFDCGDLFDRIAQLPGVVETYVGYDGAFRNIYHVRSVKQTADTDFEQDDLSFFLGEPAERRAHDHLEPVHLFFCLIDGIPYGLRNPDKIIVGDLLSVDLHALIVSEYVRRSEQRGPVSRLSEDAGDHGAGTAFAVRPCDMYEFQFFMRVAQQFEKGIDPGKVVVLVRAGVRIDEFQCFLECQICASCSIMKVSCISFGSCSAIITKMQCRRIRDPVRQHCRRLSLGHFYR